VQEPGNSPLSSFSHHLFEPQRLLVLLRLAAAHQQCVEPDKTPALRTFCDVLDPAISAEMTLPRAKPLGIDRLAGMASVADIMVAGHCPPANSKFVQELSGITEVNLGSGAIDGHIAGMDHEIGMLVGDPGRKRHPIVGEIWLALAEMRVGNLNNSRWLTFRSNPTFADKISRYPRRTGF
jgi:hypothetical protein